MERKWNEEGDILLANGDKDLQNWAYCANQIISNMGENAMQYGVERNDLKLDCLFDEIIRISKEKYNKYEITNFSTQYPSLIHQFGTNLFHS